MPQAAITFVAGLLVKVGVAAAAASFLATTFVYAASTYLLMRVSEALTPRQKSAGLGSGSEVNYYDSGAPVRIVYGLMRTGGMETIPAYTSGQTNSLLHKVLTLAGHEVDSYTHAHFDSNTIAVSAIGPMAFTASDGLVTSGVYSGHANIRLYRGTSTDSADRILCQANTIAFGKSRAPGISKAAIAFKYNTDIYKQVPTCTFTYQGKRCYDPRLDSTPGANPTNPSFIAWTKNNALCTADYLMSALGGAYDSTDIDWDTVVTAANTCDASVTTPTGTQPRYTCNGVLFATDDFTDNVKSLIDSMLGRCIFRDGKWRIYAGSWQTPSFTVNKIDWISGLGIVTEQGRQKRYNRMRTWFVDSAREWQRLESMPISNSSYLAQDKNEVIDGETEQLLCTNEFEAQRKGTFLLRQSRNQMIVTGKLPPRMQDIALWDTGYLNFDEIGLSSLTFRAVGLDVNPDGSVDAAFAEEYSTNWTDLTSADYVQFAGSVSSLSVSSATSVPKTWVTQVNCTASVVNSGAGALHNSILAHVDFSPSSLNADATVKVDVSYRQGLQNLNGFQNVLVQFVSGVTSTYQAAVKVPVGGTTVAMQPVSQLATFSYTAGNSAYVELIWDVASGSNSFTMDQMALRTEFQFR